MSSSEPKSINLDQTSIINLKAELSKKQDEFRLKRISKYESSQSGEYDARRTLTTWGKKKTKETESEQVKEKEDKTSAKTSTNDQFDESEESLLQKSKKILESKAKFYEEVVHGQKRTEEGDDELFLVDFDRKIIDNKPDVHEDEGAKLKLKAEIDERQYNQQLKQKWEEDATKNQEKDTIHYADVRFDEIRNLGVGNYRFSQDEEERRVQMEFFKKIQSETKMNRIQNEIYKLKREKSLLDRLNKVKQRRYLKAGYTLEQINQMPNFQEDMDSLDEEIDRLESLVKNPHLIDSNLSDEIGPIEAEQEKYAFRKTTTVVRDWDRPKLKERLWQTHLNKQRNKRNMDFAPPTSYESGNRKKHKKPKLQAN